ncbi:hypothetical protein [Pelagicoccus sp. SDUM812003]|uniref:hypothetical protein n=1 Tax=Pelagicoccus sp. SDUM812003 TaxID=3041267 RepID=UPI00280ED102|nr:hypothetical protein [Pelagicoccus sp. SDUM812003]MDQ8205592.1 hypothetical protein [Pelagicoccus sp. SDUM812003]
MEIEETGQPRGLLISQIGYELGGSKRLVYRGPKGSLGEGAVFEVLGADGPVFLGKLQGFGPCWGSYWWIGDFSSLDECGAYTVALRDGDVVVDEAATRIGEDLLYRETWEAVSVGQAERRQWMIESRLGWFDAGMLWQEANSHAAYLLGLCDMRELRGGELSQGTIRRLDRQIATGCSYLSHLQDLAAEANLGEGCLVHQSFKFDRVVLTADVSKAAAAWARSAAVVDEQRYQAERREWSERSRKALRWLEDPQPTEPSVFNRFAYGVGEQEHEPAGWATTDILMMLEAEWFLAGGVVTEASVRWARELRTRQVKQEESEDGYYGMFRQYGNSTATVKAWTHGMLEGGVLPTDLGNTLGFYLFPLLRMVRSRSGHPDESPWRETLRDFAYGFFLPGCCRNPFSLCPNGHFAGQGAVAFAGLWHGCNAIYGIAAALAREFAQLFNDDAFRAIADANLQWIAGLNAGLTSNALASCILFQADVPESKAVPVSMIQGIGSRTAGSWLNVRGSICNGFSVGEQFSWDVPATSEDDGPHRFTDEDWITHAGGWLMGVARSRAVRSPSGD